MPYTFKKRPDNLVEVFQDGQRISTGTGSAAARYGYSEAATPVAPIQPVSPTLMATAVSPTVTQAPVSQPTVLPEYFYESARNAIAGGTLTPEQAFSSLQAVAKSQFGGEIDRAKLFAPGLNIKTPSGRIADFNPDFSGSVYYKTPEVRTSQTNILGEPSGVPRAFQTFGDYLKAVGGAAGYASADARELQGLAEEKFGTTGQPRNLYEYYTALGQSLPSISDRRLLYQQLGLGEAASYTGEVSQNQELLEALLGSTTGATKAVTTAGTVQPPTAVGAISDAGQPSTTEASAAEVLRTIGYTPLDEAEVITKAMQSPEVRQKTQLLEAQGLSEQAKAEAKKQLLETTFQAEKESLENKLAERGLAFSGIRSSQVKALADSLASSQLGVDRELASTLLNYDAKLLDVVLDSVADTVKSANDNNKLAIEQLNKAGYAFVAGRIVPTIEAIRVGEKDIVTNVITDGNNRYVLGIDKNSGEEIWRTRAGEAASRNRVIYKDIGNEVHKIILDSQGNTISDEVAGLSGTAGAKLREAIAAFSSADAMLDSIENLAKKVIVAKETKDIPAQYISGTVDSLLKSHPDAAVYLSTYQAFASMLTRAAGEKGVLTTQDVDRITNALPKLTDTVDVMNGKLRVLNNLYESIKDGTISAYSGSISDFTPSTNQDMIEVDLSDLDFSGLE